MANLIRGQRQNKYAVRDRLFGREAAGECA